LEEPKIMLTMTGAPRRFMAIAKTRSNVKQTPTWTARARGAPLLAPTEN
jgi:hypothetical protein